MAYFLLVRTNSIHLASFFVLRCYMNKHIYLYVLPIWLSILMLLFGTNIDSCQQLDAKVKVNILLYLIKMFYGSSYWTCFNGCPSLRKHGLSFSIASGFWTSFHEKWGLFRVRYILLIFVSCLNVFVFLSNFKANAKRFCSMHFRSRLVGLRSHQYV